MTREQSRAAADQGGTERPTTAGRPAGEDEPIGVEIGMRENGTTFEPEEDPEGG